MKSIGTDHDLADVRTKARDAMPRILTVADTGEKALPRPKGADPIRIASFEC